MMTDKCVLIDGAIIQVTDKFDDTEGSEDMKAMRELIQAVREKVANDVGSQEG